MDEMNNFQTLVCGIAAALMFGALMFTAKACNESDNRLKTQAIEQGCVYAAQNIVCAGRR